MCVYILKTAGLKVTDLGQFGNNQVLDAICTTQQAWLRMLTQHADLMLLKIRFYSSWWEIRIKRITFLGCKQQILLKH